MSYQEDPGWQYLRLAPDKLSGLQTAAFDSKKDCWVPDPEEGFVHGKIKSTKGDTVTVSAKGGERTIKKDECQEMNPPKFEMTEDMSNLTFLNDASVLHNLRNRYSQMLIYTYSGLFCVVVNPYKRLPIYTESVAKMFMGKRKNEMPPHLFAVSDEAYRYMLQDRENQSMLITGESGAGKTENTKKVIAYFASVGASQQKVEGANKVTLEDQIVRTNPVLEAFGNAKTVRNNNSSRFGKFIRIHFSKDGKVAGCDIEHYLLEKSRVVRQAPGERCYHIFYQIMSGCFADLPKKLLLDKPLKDYWFVAQAELKIDGVDDKEEMQMTSDSFDILGFTPDDKESIYKICAFIMHLGNMKFKQRPREEQAEPDGTDEAQKGAENVGVNHEELLKAFCKPRVKVGTEWVNKGQNLEQVNWAMGAMAKGFYARLFDVLVKRCNITLDAKTLPREYFIGVLDIAGFEIFDLNSFEQLWINFVNEKLQQFFNHHMFVLEQEEYSREGIQWEFIDFGLDLQACIELIEKPLGVISMLDEECIVPKATDMTLAQKLNDQHLGKHPNFQKPKPPKGKQAEAHFALVHYAGVVRYNVQNWLEKNKDPLNDTVVSVLKSTADNVIQECWASYTTQEEAAKKAKENGGGGGGGKKKGKSGSMMTVSMLYRESLNNLMAMLNSTHPHFIRCIIPNEKKASGVIDAGLVLNQLTCNGVLEGIRICRKGFPNRLLHGDFKQRYSILAADAAKSSTDPKVCADAILAQLSKEGGITTEQYRIGGTKVFFKAGTLAQLEEMRDEKLSVILTMMQSKIRWFLAQKEKKRLHEQRSGVVILQRNIKSWCTLRTWEWFKLFGQVRPLVSAGKKNEEMENTMQKLKEIEEKLAKEESARKELEEQNSKLVTEKNDIFMKLEQEKATCAEYESQNEKLTSQNRELDKKYNTVSEQLEDEEDKNADLQKAKKKVENELENQKKNVQELELNLKRTESERAGKEAQNRSLQDEMAQQDQAISKLGKDKKNQEEINRKLMEDIQAEEEKVNNLNRTKSKLEQHLDEIEDNLEREKRQRAELEKQKRKLEGELKIALENQDETERQKNGAESNAKRKDTELQTLQGRIEDEQSLVAKLQRTIKEQNARIQELEEELEAENNSRAKVERMRNDLQRELEELSERLEESGGANNAQMEINKRRDAEIAKLRRDMESSNMNYETQLSGLRKKHADAVAEFSDQLEAMQKHKAKLEKEKVQLASEIEDLNAGLDSEAKAKGNMDKTIKTLEIQLSELQIKADEQNRQLQDFTHLKNRLHSENSDLTRQIEDTETGLFALQRLKTQLTSQLDEARRVAEEESQDKQSILAELKNSQHECENLRQQIEEEIEGKEEVMRQLSKANADVQQWKAKFDSEGIARAEELEEAKRKLAIRVSEVQEALDMANTKINSLEKGKVKLLGDLDDAQVDVERANAFATTLEKKQKGFDRTIEEWKQKNDSLAAELDASQRDSRSLSTEMFRLRNTIEEMTEQIDSLKRENASLMTEVKDMTDQLGEGGRSVHELQKIIRRHEVEKDEMQRALDEAEGALEAEEAKVMRAQVEVSQIRAEIERRIQEKEEEFENTRKNHQRAMDSMQASLESESKGRADLLRIKKKLESDINELEIALDHANKAYSDAQRNIKKYQDQIRELQLQIEEEQREKDTLNEQYNNAEKKYAIIIAEREELMQISSNATRAQKLAEAELEDLRNSFNELSADHNSALAQKRKIESEMTALQADYSETLDEQRKFEEQAKRFGSDVTRLSDELAQEQEHSRHLEAMRKNMEGTIKDLSVRLDEAEGIGLAGKGGKKLIAKLEAKVKQLEMENDGEIKKNMDLHKNLNRLERKIHELEFQIEEDKKGTERMQDLIDKLQGKIKTYKRQMEEAEEVANANLSKYRQLAQRMEDAEERADMAENSLSKMRAKNRSASVMPGAGAALATSASVAMVVRSPSASRPFRASSVMDLGH